MISYMLAAETENWCPQTLSEIAAMFSIGLIALAGCWLGSV